MWHWWMCAMLWMCVAMATLVTAKGRGCSNGHHRMEADPHNNTRYTLHLWGLSFPQVCPYRMVFVSDHTYCGCRHESAQNAPAHAAFMSRVNPDSCKEKNALKVEGLWGVFNVTIVLKRDPNSQVETRGVVTRTLKNNVCMTHNFDGRWAYCCNHCDNNEYQVNENGFTKNIIFRNWARPNGPMNGIGLRFSDKVPSALEWVSVHVECAKDGSYAFTCQFHNEPLGKGVSCNVPDNLQPHYNCHRPPTQEDIIRRRGEC